MKSETKFATNSIYALAFGLFLGLCILKFGNPVILDQKIQPPSSLSDAWSDAWPTHWANWFLWPLVVVGVIFIWPRTLATAPRVGPAGRARVWLCLPPLLWLGWQLASMTHTDDSNLTALTLWQFFGCAACYFIGLFLLGDSRAMHLLMAGILIAFAICLIGAIRQRIEFPATYKSLIEGERVGWINTPPDVLLELKRDQFIIRTNGVDVANPAIIARLAKNRVMGTLVYPNSLAGMILLLFPVSLVLAFNRTKNLRRTIRVMAIGMTMALGGAAFFWTGSKLGWLLATFIGGLCLLRLNWPPVSKITAFVGLTILCLGIFGVRFHHYFTTGATSAVARLTYWRAAVETTWTHPLFGTGPGTFQRPYAKLKPPNAEMARLAHNDYLEQFSDSGLPGGILYTTWVIAALFFLLRRVWITQNQGVIAIFLGLLAWFAQEFGEFGLFIPASGWTAFALLGSALGVIVYNGSNLPLRGNSRNWPIKPAEIRSTKMMPGC